MAATSNSASSKSPQSRVPKPAADAVRLENQLCFALYSASLTMTKVYKPWLASHGLTYPQYVTLLALWERDDQTVGELGEQLFLDSGTLTPLLKRMEAAGLLKRQRAEDDERVVRISLTAKGHALQPAASEIHAAVACSTGCNPAELRALTKRLQQLRADLARAAP